MVDDCSCKIFSEKPPARKHLLCFSHCKLYLLCGALCWKSSRSVSCSSALLFDQIYFDLISHRVADTVWGRDVHCRYCLQLGQVARVEMFRSACPFFVHMFGNLTTRTVKFSDSAQPLHAVFGHRVHKWFVFLRARCSLSVHKAFLQQPSLHTPR